MDWRRYRRPWPWLWTRRCECQRVCTSDVGSCKSSCGQWPREANARTASHGSRRGRTKNHSQVTGQRCESQGCDGTKDGSIRISASISVQDKAAKVTIGLVVVFVSRLRRGRGGQRPWASSPAQLCRSLCTPRPPSDARDVVVGSHTTLQHQAAGRVALVTSLLVPRHYGCCGCSTVSWCETIVVWVWV